MTDTLRKEESDRTDILPLVCLYQRHFTIDCNKRTVLGNYVVLKAVLSLTPKWHYLKMISETFRDITI